MINQIHKQFGVRLEVRTMFDHPRIIDITGALEAVLWEIKETVASGCYEEVLI